MNSVMVYQWGHILFKFENVILKLLIETGMLKFYVVDMWITLL